ncbi:MAG: hypothetical protein K8I03_11615 [Ignavibacteria bacterium]|nr:hypothetical protein [Ignavibacteria bacterium]
MIITSGITAQGNKKPDPIDNETISMLLGKWEAEPYEMFGSKRSETLSYSLDINGQFMFINVEGKDETGYTYRSLVVVKVAKDGGITGWSFDDWGKVGNYTGTASGNKVTVTGTKEGSTDSREFEINGNKMVLKLSFSMTMDGKDMVVNQTINYNKK